jgi:AraC-like DNA-binding protein
MREDPPSRRLILKKMNRAVELLLSGDWKVKQVAYELGYATQFHFSSVFKRHFGHPPKALQQRRRRGVITTINRPRSSLSL